MLGVLAYHAGIRQVPGGLLGVDVFFVLSGFLITRLLLAEHRRAGRVSLGQFWLRRARRLVPALLIMLIGISAFATWVASPGSLGRLRIDALSTLGYVANWRFSFSHQGYFQQFQAPSPLLHTWSLAVEEQFYLIWPLITVLALRRWSGDGRPRRLLLIAGLGALASAGLCLALALRGTDTSRMYYGTDTRAQALLVGATLACLGIGSRAPGVHAHDRETPAARLAGAARPRRLGGRSRSDLVHAARQRRVDHALPRRLLRRRGSNRRHGRRRDRAAALTPRAAVRRAAAALPRAHLVRRVPLPLAAVPGADPLAGGCVRLGPGRGTRRRHADRGRCRPTT